MSRLVIWQKHSASFLHSILVFSESSSQIAANHLILEQRSIPKLPLVDSDLRSNKLPGNLSCCQSPGITSHGLLQLEFTCEIFTWSWLVEKKQQRYTSVEIGLLNRSIIIIYVDWFSHDFVFNKTEMKQTSEWINCISLGSWLETPQISSTGVLQWVSLPSNSHLLFVYTLACGW